MSFIFELSNCRKCYFKWEGCIFLFFPFFSWVVKTRLITYNLGDCPGPLHTYLWWTTVGPTKLIQCLWDGLYPGLYIANWLWFWFCLYAKQRFGTRPLTLTKAILPPLPTWLLCLVVKKIDDTCVLVCVCLCMRVWKSVGKVININKY